MPSYAEQIAIDVISQIGAAAATAPWAVPAFEAQFDRMYVSDLEDLAPPDGTTDQMQLVLAPVESSFERTGWGSVRITVTLGMLFNVAVKTAAGQVTDPNIANYETLVDQVCTFLLGPRKFADVWSAKDPTPIFGDHYNDHLYGKSEFHVPVLVDFIADLTAS